MRLPDTGTARDALLARMRERKEADADWRGGRTWSLIYPAGEDVDELLREANLLYLYENALNPFRFPSLREMEAEVISMTGSMLHAPEGSGGAMTSGGTESILLATKTARNRARAARGVTAGNLVAPFSAHPAFAKACEVLGLEHRQAPLAEDLRADVRATAELVDANTVLVVGSAPGYPHGLIDPIAELAAMAAERGVPFHTDACVGGFLLPFLGEVGVEVPPFDFRVEGVESMSADVHKYGFATKGASVVLHRDQANLAHQAFLFDRWPGGMYGSMAMAGARPAAPIAAAWAVMNYLGREGYVRLVGRTMDAARRLKAGIEAIDGLKIWGSPPASLLAFGSESVDIMAVGDVMDERGWHLDRQTGPAALHMMISPEHDRIVDAFLGDLRDAVANHGPASGKQARYN